MTQKRYMVSVFMLTYNQKNFVAQAIEGVLMQQTDFDFQLVIGDDLSKDGTREICLSYAEKYPNQINLLLNERNLGIGANFVKTYTECTGKYIAICDGDDYWTDPLKLQKQVDFLESNSNYDIIFTNNENLYPAGKKHVRKISNIPGTSSFRELVFGNYIASVTVLFRKRKLSAFLEDLIKDLPYGDWPTYLWVTKEGGKIHFLNDVTSVYRKDSGTSAVLRRSKSRIGEVNLTILQYLKQLPEFVDLLPEIEQAILKLKTGLMASYFREDKISKSIKLWFDLKKKTGFLGPTRTYIYLIKLKLKKKVQKI